MVNTRRIKSSIGWLELVTVNGRDAGLITRRKDSPGDTHPYLAFALDGNVYSGKLNTKLGAFYSEDCGAEAARASAIDVIQRNWERGPAI